MASDIDVLCMGHFVLEKTAQRSWMPVELAHRPGAVLEDVWCSPCHQAPLEIYEGHAVCMQCRRRYPFVDGVPQMLSPEDAVAYSSDVMTQALSRHQQSEDEPDSIRTLIDASRRSQYSKLLNDAIPYNSTVLDVGCGTGQLTNFLGISCRRVIGADLRLDSLRLASHFARQQALSRVGFVQMNLFRPCFKPEQFDVVLCNGVLHHTTDPVAAFEALVPLVRPGGHLVLALHNRYGRLLTDTRASVASAHTIGEVMGWFDDSNLQFVRGIPRVTLGGDDATRHNLFVASPRGTGADHFWVQARHIVAGRRDGGLFLMIAKKPALAVQSRAAKVEDERLALAWQ